MIYFKRKANASILVSETGIELPDVVIVPFQIIVDLKIKYLQFTWAFWFSPAMYLQGKKPFGDVLLNMRKFNFIFKEDTNPNLQQALNIFDWGNGGELSEQGEQTALAFFGGQPDPTSEGNEDTISDNWDGMIYNP